MISAAATWLLDSRTNTELSSLSVPGEIHVQAHRSRSCSAGIAGAIYRNDRHLDAGPGKFVRSHAAPMSPSCPAFGTGSRAARPNVPGIHALMLSPHLRSGWLVNPAMTGAAPEKSGHSWGLALAW